MSDSQLMIEILRGIRSDFTDLRTDMNQGFSQLRREMSQGFAEVRSEIAGTNERVDRMSEAMIRGFTGVHQRIDVTNERIDATNERLDATNERLDGLRDLSGEKWRDLDQRVGVIETRLDRLDPR